MGTPPIKDLVKMYVDLRDRKATLEAQHKGRIKQIDEWMTLLEGLIGIELSEEEARTGKPSISTANGTAYRETKTKYVLADKDVLFDAFEDTPRRLLDFFTQAVSKTEVVAYMQSMREKLEKDGVEDIEVSDLLPPGIDERPYNAVVVRSK